jgi:hypothetical protein
MIVEILLLLVILWIVTSSYQSKRPESKRLNEVELELEHVLSDLDYLCNVAAVKPNFTLVPSETSSWVEDKRCIHLLVWDSSRKRLYDHNTIMHAAIHELVHVLCPSPKENALFKQMEDYFLQLAEREKLIQGDPDPEYPCLDDHQDHYDGQSHQSQQSQHSQEYDTRSQDYFRHEGYSSQQSSTETKEKAFRFSLRSR